MGQVWGVLDAKARLRKHTQQLLRQAHAASLQTGAAALIEPEHRVNRKHRNPVGGATAIQCHAICLSECCVSKAWQQQEQKLTSSTWRKLQSSLGPRPRFH
jgi:hypothetical protein